MMVGLDYVRMWNRARKFAAGGDAGEIAWLRHVLQPGQTVLDVGGHKGAYTYWMRKAVGAAGRVVVFEPQPALAERLRRGVRHWPNVHVEWLALSSADGELELHVPRGGPSPVATLEARDGDEYDHIRVPVTTLDHYDRQHALQPVALIKVDVEGHELEFFRGAERVLRRDRPLLLFECEARHRPDGVDVVFDWLTALGYEGQFFEGKELRPLTAFDPAIHQAPDRQPYCNNFMFSAA